MPDESYSPDAVRKFQTFLHYVEGWKFYIESSLRDNQASTILDLMNKEGKLSALHPDSRAEEALSAAGPHYVRGELTLRYMKSIPSNWRVTLAPPACMWLPVQSYYAVHGLGQAALIAMGSQISFHHTPFLKQMLANLTRPIFPNCLAPLCVAGASPRDPMLYNIGVTLNDCRSQHHLETVDSSNCMAIVGKSLVTTREELIAIKQDEERRKMRLNNKDRVKLSPSTVIDIRSNAPDVSVIHFLYRMRSRANYDDPDMFLIPQLSSPDFGTKYCDSILSVTSYIAEVLKAIISSKLGPKRYAALQAALPPR